MWFPSRGALAIVTPLFLSLLSTSPVHAEEPPLTFDEAIRLAVSRNERALASGELLEAAEARVARARAFFFPDVQATGSYTRRPYETVRNVGGQDAVISKYDGFSSVLTAKQVLFDARALPIWRQARTDRDAARLEAAEERRLVAFEAADAFLRTLTFARVAEAAGRRVDLARQNLSDARARFEAQITSSNDVTRAELEVATAEREATRAHNEEQTSRLALENLLVLAAPRALAAPEELLTPPAGALPEEESLVARARERRLDVAAGKKRAEALHFYAKEPMNRFFPSLLARADGRWTNESGLSGRSTTWTYGLDLTWSLFDSAIRFGDARERRANARAADLTARARERAVELEVRTALASLDNARAAMRQATVALDAARKNAAETTTLYREGLANALAVADANQSLFEADVERTRELYGLGGAVLDLYASQGLDPEGKEPRP
jgi:outer membrane protein TolC